MNDAISQFKDAIRATGLEPPDVIEPGKLHRFPGVGKRNSNKAGWCKLFNDGLGGCFGDWSSDLSENWQAKRDKPFSKSERAAFMRRVDGINKSEEKEKQKQYAEAAKKAASIWNSAKQANDEHPYLIRKGIKPNGVRLHKDALIVPVRSSDEIHSLQFITEDGGKRFLSGGRITGGYFSIGITEGKSALCIAEGFATGATIHQATGYPVAVAFNAGNLEFIAKAMRQKFPGLSIIVCADDDAATTGNPGLTKAKQAALAIGGRIAIPEFGNQRPEGATDFNDMAALSGLESVAKAIEVTKAEPDHAGNSDGYNWPAPLPLIAKIDPQPYPLDALPDTIKEAVNEALKFTKAPIPLVASSALAALSLAGQAYADVKRAEGLCGPSSLFILTIADSGERKSTCDNFFMQPLKDYEAQQAEAAKPLNKKHEAEKNVWEAKQGGIKEKIRQLAKSGKPSQEQEAKLRDLENEKPEPPRSPRLIYTDATPEALKWNLAKCWPSGGVVSSEAGLVLGSHGMSNDSVMRNLATLNQLWDGAEIATERRSTESFTVRGARLTIALQVQGATLQSFLDRSGGLARGTGFLARFLLALPYSTQGSRLYSDPPKSWPALEKYHKRITVILEKEVSIDESGALSPAVFSLAADAKAAWIKFHDQIESELCVSGELYDVRDVASKSADNAVRIAALFQLFENDTDSQVGLAAFEGASKIAAWHLYEARRFFGELALPEEQADAARLDSWLLDHCQREKTNIIARREVQRNVSPIRLRQKAALNMALDKLIEKNRIRFVRDGQCKNIYINPALLEEGVQ